MKINNEVILSVICGENSHFSHSGCDNCANGLGHDVYQCGAHPHRSDNSHFTVNLCADCVCAYYYANELPDDCNNVYEI